MFHFWITTITTASVIAFGAGLVCGTVAGVAMTSKEDDR